MHIFLTGPTGLLGSAFARAAKRRGHYLTGIVHRTKPPEDLQLDKVLEGDLADDEWVVQQLLDVFPDAVVNAAAVSQPEACEADPEGSQKLNVDLPARLGALSHHLSARFVQISSDMVFDGEKGDYLATDAPAPNTLYGWQKLEAEKRVLQAAPEFAVVLRLPILNGNSPGGSRSIHEKLFAAWAKGEKPRLYTEEIRQPCLADNAAEVMVELCERTNILQIRHWAGSERLSRWELGRRILEHFNLPESLIEPASPGEDPRAHKRPVNLTLQLAGLDGKLKTRRQTLEQQLDALIVPPPAREWYHSQ